MAISANALAPKKPIRLLLFIFPLDGEKISSARNREQIADHRTLQLTSGRTNAGISETDAATRFLLPKKTLLNKKTDAPKVLLPLVPEDLPLRGLRDLRVLLDAVCVLGVEAAGRSGGELRVFLEK